LHTAHFIGRGSGRFFLELFTEDDLIDDVCQREHFVLEETESSDNDEDDRYSNDSEMHSRPHYSSEYNATYEQNQENSEEESD
jgi:hypothetical protein